MSLNRDPQKHPFEKEQSIALVGPGAPYFPRAGYCRHCGEHESRHRADPPVSTLGPNLADLETLLGSLGLEPEWCNLPGGRRPSPDSPAGQKLTRIMDRLAGGLVELGWIPPGEEPTTALGPNLAERDLDMRLGGFADAEGLILAMVMDMDDKEHARYTEALVQASKVGDGFIAKGWEVVADQHRVRAQVLEELELALRMGQHRTAEYGDPDLAMDKVKAGKLARAHQQLANGLRGKAGSGQASEGGRKASSKLTKDERVRRAKNAAESRYNGTGKRKPGTKSKKGGVE